MPNATEQLKAHAETVLLTALWAAPKCGWLQLKDLRPLLATAGMSVEDQDAALRWLQLGNTVTVDVEDDGNVRTLGGVLAPESSARRNRPEWLENAYAPGTHQRADMITVEDQDS